MKGKGPVMRVPTVVSLLLAAAALYGQGSTYQWIRELGGSDSETALGVALDAAGNTYVTGSTYSHDFPVKSAMQPLPAGPPLYRIDGTSRSTKVYGAGASSILSLAFSRCQPRTLYAGGNGFLLRSPDLGASWERFALPEGAALSIAVACDRPGEPAIFVSTIDRLYRTRDLRHWEQLSPGVRGTQQVVVDPHVPGTVYARTTEGLAVSQDAGDEWRLTGATAYQLAFGSKPGTVYTALFVGGSAAILPAVSTDFGANWRTLSALPGRDTYPQAVVPDPRREGVLYAIGYSTSFVSTDAGRSWAATKVSVTPPVAVDWENAILYARSSLGVVATRDGFETATSAFVGGPSQLTDLAAQGGVAFASTYASRDVFLTKLNPDGELVYSTYLGGASDDVPTAMAAGADGSVYVAGQTYSPDFPASRGPAPIPGLLGSGFVSKFRPDGELAYSIFFNGTVNQIRLASDGSAILAGTSYGGLETTPGAYQTEFRGTPASFKFAPRPANAFVTKLSPDGASVIYSTYLGEQSDTGDAMVLGGDGSVYVGGSQNLFHLSADGSALLGAAPVMAVSSMARNSSGTIYTASNPVPIFSAVTLRRWTPALEVSATRELPGAEKVRVDVDQGGKVWIAGGASPLLPTLAPMQGPFSPQTGFVGSLAADLGEVLFATFAGDSRVFSVAGAAAAPGGAVVFAGSTEGSYGGGASQYAFPPSPDDGAGAQVYVARMTPRVPDLRLDSVVNAASFQAGPLAAGETVLLTGAGFGKDARVLVDGEPVEVLSRSADRILAALPPGFPASGAVQVEVASGEARSNPVLMRAAAGSPGLFSVDGSGQGQGFIRNADGTPNSPLNPASEGEAITLFVNGGTPGVPAGAFVHGFEAKVLSARLGSVEGLPGNVYQLVAVVPRPSELNPDLRNFKFPPAVQVYVVLAGARSQNGITLSLKQE